MVGEDGLQLHVASVAAATRRLGRAPPSPPPGLVCLLCGPRAIQDTLPTTPGAVPTVRSRPDASELEICCLLVSFRPLASRVFGRKLLGAIARLLLC